MAFSGLKVPGSLELFTNLEIEHILPNKPETDLRAKRATENPGMVYDDYKNRLGNLSLLEKPINIVAGNDFYTAKQVEYSIKWKLSDPQLGGSNRRRARHLHLADQRQAGGFHYMECSDHRKTARSTHRIGARRLENKVYCCLNPSPQPNAPGIRVCQSVASWY